MITKFNIFESNTLPDFEFAIDIRNASEEDLLKATKEFERYTDYVKIDKDVLTSKTSNGYITWAWIIDISNSFSKKKIFFNKVTSPGWGSGVEYMEDIITIDEFLKVGLTGVKNLVKQKREERKLKKDTEKYNL